MSQEPRAAGPRSDSLTGLPALAEARFVPRRYEPNYAYPLLVLFHGRGGDEQQLLEVMPALSRRNYIGLSLRGPEPLSRRGRPLGFGWGPAFAHPARLPRRPFASEPPAQVVRRVLAGGPCDAGDRIEDAVFGAVRDARRSLHVHSERIFLVGVGEGAAVAYRLALAHPERFAGIVAIHGWLPGGAPLARLRDCRGLRVLVVHGEWNGRAPIEHARRHVATLRAGGLRVAFQSYPCASRLAPPMLADVDTWLMSQCTGGTA
jgi:phospholipase/carboxylesterase